MGTPYSTINRHCGLDPQSLARERLSSRIGDGGSLSAMTVKGFRVVYPMRKSVIM